MPTVARGNPHVPALSKSPALDESVACVGFFLSVRRQSFTICVALQMKLFPALL